MQLLAHFLDNKGKPIHKNVHYFAAYERHFLPFVSRPSICSTRCEHGLSL